MDHFTSTDIKAKKDVQFLLTFKLDNEFFALSVHRVIELIEVPAITRIPRAPDYMSGVINIRGNVIPLIDTRIKFGLNPIEFTENTCVVVMELNVEGENLKVGALVDEVLEVLEIPKGEIQPSPSIEAKYSLDFIEGMFRHDEEFVMILNLGEVFSLSEVDVMREANDSVMSNNNDKSAKD